MLTALALVLLPQRLDPPEDVAHPGDPVSVRAIDQDGAPLAGIVVRITPPDGVLLQRTADARGRVEFTPDRVGTFELHMQPSAGPEVFAVYQVVSRPRRWLYALVLTPLGLLLVWVNLRRLGSARGSC